MQFLLLLLVTFTAPYASVVPAVANSRRPTALRREVECPLFHSGPTCDKRCPGIQNDSCSDTGCVGLSDGNCNSPCIWSVKLQMCLGSSSCYSNICRGNGACEWGREKEGNCVCNLDYYGENCDTYCSVEDCYNTLKLPNIVCQSDGRCGCPDSEDGHFDSVDQQCSLCHHGWYGYSCEKECDCSGHGSCHRTSGVCQCDADPELGYWSGGKCAVCLDGFWGRLCTEKGASLTAGSTSSLSLLDWNTSYPTTVPFFAGGSQNATVLGWGQEVWCAALDREGNFTSPQRCSMGGPVVGVGVLDNGTRTALISGDSFVRLYQESEVACQFLVKTESTKKASSKTVDACLYGDKWAVIYTDLTVFSYWGNYDLRDKGASAISSVYINTNSSSLNIVASCEAMWCLFFSSFVKPENALKFSQLTKSDFSGVDFTGKEVLWGGFYAESTASVVLLQTPEIGNGTIHLLRFATSQPTFEGVTTLNLTGQHSVYVNGVVSSAKMRVIKNTIYVDVKTDTRRVLCSVFIESNGSLTQFSQQTLDDVNTAARFDLVPSWRWISFVSFVEGNGDPSIRMTPFTSYSVKSISPTVADNAGGTMITVSGYGFTESVKCTVDGRSLATTFVSVCSLLCVALDREKGKEYCYSDYLNVFDTSSPVRMETNNTVGFRRVQTPQILYAIANKGAYVGVGSDTSIKVYGQGFLASSNLSCSFQDGSGWREITKGTHASSDLVSCSHPKTLTGPTKKDSGTLSVSLDGTVFSNEIPFTFIGPAHGLIINGSSSITVRSSSHIQLEPIRVAVVDSEGHQLRELDSVHIVEMVPISFVSTRQDYPVQMEPLESLVTLAFINQTTDGETSFTLYLQNPRVGVGKIVFSSELDQNTTFLYNVEEGIPHKMAIAVQPCSEIHNVYYTSCRQPVILFQDEANNVILNLETLSGTLVSEVQAQFFNGVGQETVLSDPSLSIDGQFTFSDVFPRGAYGSTYHVTFYADGFNTIESAAMEVTPCFSTQFAQVGSILCQNCPAHSKCNGTFSFNVTDGFWKGGVYAYRIMECPVEEACRGGACTEGYTGTLCGLCAAGYGRSGKLCGKCFNNASNIVLLILSILFVCVLLFFLACLLFQITGPHKLLFPLLTIFLDFYQMSYIVLLPLRQLPSSLSEFKIFLGIVGFADLIQVKSTDCLFHLNAHARFLIAIVVPFVTTGLIYVIILYVKVLRKSAWRRQKAKQLFLRSIAPFQSAQAYYERIGELGLDDEPTLAAGKSTTVNELEIQKEKVVHAYSLMDKNRSTLSTIGQLPMSKAKEVALRLVLEEQIELEHYLDDYETYVSHRDTKANRSKNFRSNLSSTSDKNSSDHMPSTLEHLSTPHQQSDSANMQLDIGSSNDPASLSITEGIHYSGVPPQRGGGFLAAVNRVFDRFPSITPTRFALFGGDEIQPVPVSVEQMEEGDSNEKNGLQRDYQKEARVPFHLYWPNFRYQYTILLGITTIYLYPLALLYSFSLVPCQTVEFGRNNVLSNDERSASLLESDLTIDCTSSSHRAYRTSAIVLGCIYGVGSPAALLYFCFSRTEVGHVIRYIIGAAFGFNSKYLWWTAVVLLRKFTLIILLLFIPQPLGSIIALWVTMALVALTYLVSPHSVRRLNRINMFILSCVILTQLIQLIPFFILGKGEYSIHIGKICSAFIILIILFCTVVLGLCAVLVVFPLKFIKLPSKLKNFFLKIVMEKKGVKEPEVNLNREESVYEGRCPFNFSDYNVFYTEKLLEQVSKEDEEARVAFLKKIDEKDSANNKLFRGVEMNYGAFGKTGHVEFTAQYLEEDLEAVDAYEEVPGLPPTTLYLMQKELSLEEGQLLQRIQKMEEFIHYLHHSSERLEAQ